ncbi:MAG: TonB-dependent receptor [Reichenbachiella sp.]|uniref:TonB-dependent receptor plug domain-containing protein n=1 Tax=Reichenbachiella sp. TaxID=2184521 RepID=UPI002966EA1C|nr:TonB-dependent receptor [Reichenbachiella sp.]MDW3211013.1 TonB-dependent receptor [Reichenbachiella sp.]
MRILKINLKHILAIGLLLHTGLSFAQEQEDLSTYTMDEFVVTGTKFELPVKKSGKSIYKLTAKDLEQNAGKTVSDLLNEVPGIQMDGNFGAPGTNISYYVRGGRNKNTLILIDGVPLNDPSGIDASFDLRFLPVSQIESIEVLKGGLSTLYGTGASAAVISIKLKEATQEGVHGQVDYSYGSFETHQVSANVNGKQDKLSYMVSGSLMESEGFSAASDENSSTDFEDDGMTQKNVNVKLGLQATEQLNIAVNAAFDEFSADYDGGAYLDADNQNNGEQFRIGFTPSYNYGDGEIKLNVLLNTGAREFESTYPSKFKSKNLQTELSHQHQWNDNFKTLIGVNAQKLSAKEVLADPNADYNDFNIIDPFASVFFDHSSGLNVHAGVRLNTHSVYDNEFIYNLNPSFLLPVIGDLSVKFLASVSTSYVTPSLYQLYSFYGNEDLSPERSTNYEGGISFYLGDKLTLNTVYFRRDETDPIIFSGALDNDGNWVSFYDNGTDEQVVKGLELDANWTISKLISLNTNYSYITTDEKTNFYRIPAYKFGIGLVVSPVESVDISVKYNLTSDRTVAYWDSATFSSVETELDSFGLVDLFANYKLVNKNLSIYGGINNAFDTDFVGIYGYTTRGRTMTIGLNYTF